MSTWSTQERSKRKGWKGGFGKPGEIKAESLPGMLHQHGGENTHNPKCAQRPDSAQEPCTALSAAAKAARRMLPSHFTYTLPLPAAPAAGDPSLERPPCTKQRVSAVQKPSFRGKEEKKYPAQFLMVDPPAGLCSCVPKIHEWRGPWPTDSLPSAPEETSGLYFLIMISVAFGWPPL